MPDAPLHDTPIGHRDNSPFKDSLLDLTEAQPTWRKPFGIMALIVGLTVYVLVVAWLVAPIAAWPVLVQMLAYLVLGTIWLLPLRRFLIWMETGRWG